jgi:RNA polymerase sigma-70 factor (ECF subfamily)
MKLELAQVEKRACAIVETDRENPAQSGNRFVTTRWSLVAAAGVSGSADAGQALEQLCLAYWQPLYWHVRRLGHQPAAAQDLTQAFIVHVLEKRLIAAADRQRGKFRTFLLTALRNFLANDYERQRAAKRGGGRVFSMDFQSAEEAFRLEPSHQTTPERAFERQWAVAVLEEAFAALEREQRAAGKGALFDALSPCLTAGDDAPRYAELAARLGLTIAAVKKAVSRLRGHYARAIREEVARTISDDDDLNEEIQSLFRAVQAELRTKTP